MNELNHTVSMILIEHNNFNHLCLLNTQLCKKKVNIKKQDFCGNEILSYTSNL